MKCPKCDREMDLVAFADVGVDRCSRCHGLWFENREAEVLRGMSGAEAIDAGAGSSAPPTGGPMMCPECRTPMIALVVHRQPHIHFESCTVCHGSFFDAGEFQDMKHLTVGEWLRSLFPRT